MKRIIFLLSVLVSFVIHADAQTNVNGKWRYFFLLVDSTLRPPQDTLASSPNGSIAVKSNTVWVKNSSGVWISAAAGSINTGEGVGFEGGQVVLGGAGSDLTSDRYINLQLGNNVIFENTFTEYTKLSGGQVLIADSFTNASAHLGKFFYRITTADGYAALDLSGSPTPTLVISDSAQKSYLSYDNSIMQIIDSNGGAALYLQNALTGAYALAQSNALTLAGAYDDGQQPFIEMTDLGDAAGNKIRLERWKLNPGEYAALFSWGQTGAYKELWYHDNGNVALGFSGSDRGYTWQVEGSDLVGDATTTQFTTRNAGNFLLSGHSVNYSAPRVSFIDEALAGDTAYIEKKNDSLVISTPFIVDINGISHRTIYQTFTTATTYALFGITLPNNSAGWLEIEAEGVDASGGYHLQNYKYYFRKDNAGALTFDIITGPDLTDAKVINYVDKTGSFASNTLEGVDSGGNLDVNFTKVGGTTQKYRFYYRWHVSSF